MYIGPEGYLEAALYFYQALRAYPSPVELIEIYKKSVPEPIYMVSNTLRAILNFVLKTLKVISELYNLDVSSSYTSADKKDEAYVEDVESNPESDGGPSETSSQEWDQVTDPGSAPGP